MGWGWVNVVRGFIGKLLDLLQAGRTAGLWDKGSGAPGLEDIKAKDREPWR